MFTDKKGFLKPLQDLLVFYINSAGQSDFSIIIYQILKEYF